jgi:deazaflavin-dependent oxidoreductase (nitroreductase family)
MPSNDSTSQTPTISPTGWVADHTRQYLESDGANGHIWLNDTPALLLTVTGRRTGRLRRTPLFYGKDGDNYLVVPSNGGSDTPPEWCLNLAANPHVEVQVGAERFPAVARDATPEEKPRMWQIMTRVWPDYDSYQDSTERQIPVIVLEPVR